MTRGRSIRIGVGLVKVAAHPAFTWYPDSSYHKYVGVGLSNGNLTATPDSAGPYESVRALLPAAVNAFEFEATLNPTFTPNSLFVGIDNGQTNYSVSGNAAGSTDSNGVTLQIFSNQWYIVRNGGISQGPFSSPTPAVAQVITVIGNKSAGTLAFYVAGTQIGTTETGVSSTGSWTNWYAYTSGKGGDGAVTGNFKGPFTLGSNTAYDGTIVSSITGTLSKTLAAVTLSSIATLKINGSVSKTLGTLTSSSTAQLLLNSNVNKTLGVITLSSTATVKINGSLSKTLGSLTSTGTSQLLINGSLNKTLGTLTLASTGTLALSGSVSRILDTLTGTETGQLLLKAVLTQPLGILSLTSTANLRLTGTTAATLGGLTLSSTGELITDIDGSVIVSLNSLDLNSTSNRKTILRISVKSGFKSGIRDQILKARRPTSRPSVQRIRY